VCRSDGDSCSCATVWAADAIHRVCDANRTGITWASSLDGKSVWATDRCSPRAAPALSRRQGNPVHRFDESGKEIKSFGGGMFVWQHGIHVDRDGNVWVADARAATPDELKKFPVKATREVLSSNSASKAWSCDVEETGREGKSSRSPD
jgi:hypothetical protein